MRTEAEQRLSDLVSDMEHQTLDIRTFAQIVSLVGDSMAGSDMVTANIIARLGYQIEDLATDLEKSRMTVLSKLREIEGRPTAP